jgi:hypothetical protein
MLVVETRVRLERAGLIIVQFVPGDQTADDPTLLQRTEAPFRVMRLRDHAILKEDGTFEESGAERCWETYSAAAIYALHQFIPTRNRKG